MVELKEKYFEMYQNPNIIIADIFDCVMKYLDIPVRFSDIKEVINCKSRKKIPPAIRSEILAAHGFKCKWCGRDSGDVKLEIDHIVPVSKGGLTEKRNLQVLCRECNCGKTDKSPYAMKA
jgi:5-methylcytosine-specific restriction endonuclease McrA